MQLHSERINPCRKKNERSKKGENSFLDFLKKRPCLKKKGFGIVYMLCSAKLLVAGGGFLTVQTPVEERMFHQQSDLFSGFGGTAIISEYLHLIKKTGEMWDCTSA